MRETCNELPNLGPRPPRTCRRKLYLAAFSVSLLYVSTGSVMAWSSPALSKLSVTKSEGAWLGSLYALGAVLGPVLSGPALHTLGRKPTLLVTGGVFIIAWILLGVSPTTFPLLVFARILGGVAVGSTFASVPVYLAEISDDKVRGALGSMNQVFVGLGFLVEFCVGPYVGYIPLLAASACSGFIFIASFIMMPESPHYLLVVGRPKSASTSLAWLRSAPKHAVLREINSIEESVESSGGGKVWELVTRRGARIALFLSLYLMLVQQLSGVNATVSFSQELFSLAAVPLSPAAASMVVGAVNTVSSGFAPPLVSNFGIKPVLVASGYGMGFCHLLLSLYFYLQSIWTEEKMSSIGFLPILSLILFNIFFCIGVGPLPWAVAAEVFPPKLRGAGMLLTGVVSWLLAFGVIRSYASLLDALPTSIVFLIYAIILLVGISGTWLFLPNTHGMSLQDIQDLLNGGPGLTEKIDEDWTRPDRY